MSSVKLQGGASGAGSVALVAPNTNSVRSLTLPDFDGLMIGSASAGTAGQMLTSAGAGAAPIWTSPPPGTVTSVDVSGGTTGLSFSGGPVTSSGTITLAGTLAVANGGTGVTTSTGTGSVVLSSSPTFTGTVSGASLSLTGQLGVGSAPLTGVILKTYSGLQGTPVATGTDVTGVNSRFQSAGVALDMGVYNSGACFMQTRLVADHSSMFPLALNPLGGPVLVGTSVYFSGQLAAGNSGTATTINFSAGQKQSLVLTGNCTISTVFPGVGNYQLLLIQDATGGRTVTWAGSVQYVGSATAPAINTVANSYTMVSIYWNGNAMWLAASKVNA